MPSVRQLTPSLSKLSPLIKVWTCLIFPTSSEITESPLKSHSISRILTLLLSVISTKQPIRNIIFNYNQVTSDPDVRSSIQSSCSCADSPFLYPTAGHVVTGDLACVPDKGLQSLFKKGPKYSLPSRIDFTKCRSIVEEALQIYCKRWSKKEGVGMHALNDWKNEFLRIVDIRIENFTTHPHLYKQPPIRSVKALKRKMDRLHSKYVFAPADKAANNVIIISKSYYVDDLKGGLNSTSTNVHGQLTKDKLLLHHIDTLTKINVKIDKCGLPTFYWLRELHKNPFKSRFISNSSHCSTTILSKHIASALTAVKDHVIKYSGTAFSNSNLNHFWSIKTLPRSSKSYDCVTFRVLRYILSTFPLYIPHCHMILSKQKCCPVLTGVSTESKTYPYTSDKVGFLATRSMTRINVGLVLSYVKPLLSACKTYMCNLKAWFINR